MNPSKTLLMCCKVTIPYPGNSKDNGERTCVNQELEFIYDGVKIKQVEHTRILGVELDYALSYKPHLTKLKGIIHMRMHMIRSLAHMRTKTAVHSIIRGYIYGTIAHAISHTSLYTNMDPLFYRKLQLPMNKLLDQYYKREISHDIYNYNRKGKVQRVHWGSALKFLMNIKKKRYDKKWNKGGSRFMRYPQFALLAFVKIPSLVNMHRMAQMNALNAVISNGVPKPEYKKLLCHMFFPVDENMKNWIPKFTSVTLSDRKTGMHPFFTNITVLTKKCPLKMFDLAPANWITQFMDLPKELQIMLGLPQFKEACKLFFARSCQHDEGLGSSICSGCMEAHDNKKIGNGYTKDDEFKVINKMRLTELEQQCVYDEQSGHWRIIDNGLIGMRALCFKVNMMEINKDFLGDFDSAIYKDVAAKYNLVEHVPDKDYCIFNKSSKNAAYKMLPKAIRLRNKKAFAVGKTYSKDI